MIISIIVAIDEKGGIGQGNQLPWHLPSDLKRFKSLTMGHHLVMGRKTYESIGKPLPGRKMVIMTHKPDYQPKGCIVVHSIKQAISIAEKNQEEELFIIGGGDVFKQAIDRADKIYLTRVKIDIRADVFFPKIDPESWDVVQTEVCIQDKKDDYQSVFEILLRKKPIGLTKARITI